MPDVTPLLNSIEAGDRRAAAELLPLVYAELRSLAAAKLAREKPGQTLDATALVHEAYLRLVKNDGLADPAAKSAVSRPAHGDPGFANRAHFFAAAAEAMRRILVENARRKGRRKHGGGQERLDVDLVEIPCSLPDEELLSLHEALTRLTVEAADKARLIELRFFLGMTIEEAAELLGISTATAKRQWRFARAWLHREMERADID